MISVDQKVNETHSLKLEVYTVLDVFKHSNYFRCFYIIREVANKHVSRLESDMK